MNLPIFYAEGTGNTFLIVINNQATMKIKNALVCVEQLINHYGNLEFDGVLLVVKHKQHEFELHYFNNDASFETLCVNGCRCAALVMHLFFGAPSNFKFVAGDGLHCVEILNNNLVKIKLSIPKYIYSMI